PFGGVAWSNCSAPCGGGRRSRQTEKNIRVREQEITCNTQSCDPIKGDCKADVIFILDSTASYSTLKWFAQKQFVIDVVQSLKVGANQTRVGVISFSRMARTDIYLGQYTKMSALTSAIWDIDLMAGDVYIHDGLLGMLDMFKQ
ncbi:hypothetical protein LSAT2_027885, partial [Lamellibrachia satsuma]